MAMIPFSKEPAQKIMIKEMLRGAMIVEADSNYLLTNDGRKMQRVNVVAFVVKKEKIGSITTCLLDDGTGTVAFRSFEESKKIEQITPGDAVLVLGKIRIYNGEKYISPEIVKGINPSWLKVRMQENTLYDQNKEQKAPEGDSQLTKKKSDSRIEETAESVLPSQKIIGIIKELDKGDGVFIEEILEKSPLAETEKIIENMLECGEIFKNMPGKIKVL